jgi:hypothetical protein
LWIEHVTSQQSKSKRILILDDKQDILIIMKYQLSK